MIEILFWIAIGIALANLIAFATGYLSWPIAIIGMVAGLGFAIIIEPFTSLIMNPLGNSLFFGYNWGLFETVVLFFIVSCFWIVGVMTYNQWKTGGIKSWL